MLLKKSTLLYNMSGNTISVKTLGLNRDFEEIKQQPDDIVAKYFN